MTTLKPAALCPRSGGKPTAPVIATIIFTTLLIVCSLLFAWSQVDALIQMLRISIPLILAKAVLEIRFYVRDSTAPFVRTSPYAWLIGLGGTLAPLMFRPNIGVPDFFVATMVQVTGLALQIYLILTLNRVTGSAVAECDLRRRGLYRFVRHPLTLAFMLSHFGYVANHTTIYNMGILAFVTFLQVLRVNEEERQLEDDEQYQEYANRTHWRVIPGVF